jgi:hypothetical protein
VKLSAPEAPRLRIAYEIAGVGVCPVQRRTRKPFVDAISAATAENFSPINRESHPMIRVCPAAGRTVVKYPQIASVTRLTLSNVNSSAMIDLQPDVPKRIDIY